MSQKTVSEALAHVGNSDQIAHTLQLLLDGYLESSLANDQEDRLAVLELMQELKTLL
jgi:hypothetical protein